MRLTSIELENFRCFEKEKIDLHPQLNVFVGLNASGKTALLEGVGIALSQFFRTININKLYRSWIVDSDVRLTNVGGRMIPQIPARILTVAEFDHPGKQAKWIVELPDPDPLGIDTDELYDVVSSWARSPAAPIVGFPVLQYFSTQRIWENGSSDAQDSLPKYSHMGTFAVYFDSLKKANGTAFFEKEIERMQKSAMQSKELHLAFDSSRLDLIRIIAARVVEDCEIFYFDYDKESLAIKFNDGRRILLNDLSDGQKSLLLISTGIAFQCATLNPHMGLDAYKSGGVVLIDEVELHLHPDWQRQILPILTREFPNIQFICTTHSPQVISSLKPENVQVIKDFKVKPLKIHTEGRDSNTILTEVFGIEKRPKEFGDKLQHFYTLLEKHAMEEAKAIFEDLENHWGTMDTEIVRARFFLEDLEDDLARAKEVAK